MASIVAADLVPYHAVNWANLRVDGSTIGGAIDTNLHRAVFTQMTANSALEVVSSNVGDTTQTVTVRARNAAGSVVTQTVTLNGTTAVAFGTLGTAERVLSVDLSASAAGTVSVRNTAAGTTWVSVPPGEKGAAALFSEGSSSTGGTVTYYSKAFWKNTNGTNALLGATVSESADPTGLVDFGLAATVGDSATATNRQTAPAGITFASTSVTLLAATTVADLASGSAIGTWVRLALATNNAAIRSTWTSQLAGSTT